MAEIIDSARGPSRKIRGAISALEKRQARKSPITSTFRRRFEISRVVRPRNFGEALLKIRFRQDLDGLRTHGLTTRTREGWLDARGSETNPQKMYTYTPPERGDLHVKRS